MSENIFAVDIGGSKLICGALTDSGEILDTFRVDYKQGYTADDLMGWIKESFKLLDKYGLCRCGAAIPGLCDPKSGTWLYSPFSGIGNIPITEMLSEITNLPAYADNDVNVSALAEKKFGCCKDTSDFLWITVSNGIGGGLYLGGDLYRGPFMTSGEIGHITVEENTDRICGCGKRGCLEAMASGASIASIYESRTGKKVSAKEIADFARMGDDEAKKVWAEAGFYIGKAVSSAVNLLGVDTVVLGGGAAQNFDLLYDSAMGAISEYTFSAAVAKVNLLHSPLGANAALLGCAALTKVN